MAVPYTVYLLRPGGDYPDSLIEVAEVDEYTPFDQVGRSVLCSLIEDREKQDWAKIGNPVEPVWVPDRLEDLE